MKEHKAADGIATTAQYYYTESRSEVVSAPIQSSSCPTPDHPPSSTNNNTEIKIAPDRAPSSSRIFSDDQTSASIHRAVLDSSNQDTKIKLEGSAASLSEEERVKRSKDFEYWQTMNIDPKTGKGRFVFRRGCHKHCITTVLGGSGMEPWPIVNRPPALLENGLNPFIKQGEYYVAGNEAWNPYGPRFPGDTGLVNKTVTDLNPGQNEFHLFVECSNKPHKRHWHGKLAAGGRMYVGVYQFADEDDPITRVEFTRDHSTENQKMIADYKVRKDYKDYNGSCNPKVYQGIVIREARKIYDGDDWDAASKRTKDTWSYVAYLMLTNYCWLVAPVKFVRFDEDLYQTLVKEDCATCKRGVRGKVALAPEALHHFLS